jgi:hypothetical protein
MRFKWFNKKTFIIIVILILFTFMLFPLSFSHKLSNSQEVWITYSENIYSDHQVDRKNHQFTYNNGSEEYHAICKVLQKHKYHCNFRTIINSSIVSGSGNGDLEISTSDGNFIKIMDSGQVMVNNHVYSLGYFGSGSAKKLLQEVRQILISDN